jgi:hypothetical protein
MTALRLPSHWDRMAFTAKAQYLVDSRQAADYSAACAMLAHRRRKPARIAVPAPAVGTTYWWNQ